MSHPTDDDLIFHFYGEHPPADRERIDAHLGACADCKAAWEEIGRTLQIAAGAEVPEPGPGFERIMWARVQAALPPPSRSRWVWRAFVPVASAAAFVLAVAAGARFWSARVEPQDTALAPAEIDLAEIQQTRERVLFAALDGHFAQTEVLLTELMNTPVRKKADFGEVRSTAGDLVASGRLYRTTAEQTGHRALAAMLQDLEPVLVEVARSPDKVDAATVRSLRARIDDEGLLFKVRAVNADARDR